MVSPKPGKLRSVTDPAQAYAVSIDHLDERFQDCRDLRHPWKITHDFHVVTAAEGRPRRGHNVYVERVLTCPHCGTIRKEAYVVVESSYYSSLRRLAVSYDYPDDYLLKGMPPGVGNAAEVIRGLRFSRAQAPGKRRKASGG